MDHTIKDIKAVEDTDSIPKEVVNTLKDMVVNILKEEVNTLKEEVSTLKEVDSTRMMEIAINKDKEDLDTMETGSKEDVLVDIPVDTREETDFILEDRTNSHPITPHSGKTLDISIKIFFLTYS